LIKIAITQAAFDAIANTLPLGSIAYEPAPDAKGQVSVWLDPRALDRIDEQRQQGDSYSDVILRLAAEGG
jgi:hypothetical protein